VIIGAVNYFKFMVAWSYTKGWTTWQRLFDGVSWMIFITQKV